MTNRIKIRPVGNC